MAKELTNELDNRYSKQNLILENLRLEKSKENLKNFLLGTVILGGGAMLYLMFGIDRPMPKRDIWQGPPARNLPIQKELLYNQRDACYRTPNTLVKKATVIYENISI